MISILNKFFDTDSFDRNNILHLIDKIEIDAQHEHLKIKIYFKFKKHDFILTKELMFCVIWLR